jgi:hypothetical protein
MFFLGNAVRVGADQLPHLHEMLREVCTTLDLEKPPELYLQHDPRLDAMAVGVDDPFIVLHSSLVEQLDEDEMRCVIGHEVGHVLSGHALYRTMLYVLLRVMNSVVPLYVVALPIVLALQEWSRKSELSADRAGLAVVQDLDVAQRVCLKLAGGGSIEGLDLDAFAAQAEEYEEGGSLGDNVAKMVNLAFASHPFPALRIAELRKWATSKQYEAILDGDYPERGSEEEVTVDAELVDAARHYRDGWRQAQDSLTGALKGAVRAGQSAYSAFFADDDYEEEWGREAEARWPEELRRRRQEREAARGGTGEERDGED